MDQNFVKPPYPGPGAAESAAVAPGYGPPPPQPPQSYSTPAGYAVQPGYGVQPSFGGAPPPQNYGAVPPQGAQMPTYGYPPGPAAGKLGDPAVGEPPAAAGPGEAVLPEGSASAPPFDLTEAISGYEGAGMTPTALAPPSYAEATQQPAVQREASGSTVPVVTEEEARNALLSHVAEHCCYGSAAARELLFRDLRSSSAFHYTLETFTESRSCAWACEPYTGQMIDGPQYGPAPNPWEIIVNSPPLFTDGEVVVEVPHTASVKGCTRCHQSGKVRCTSCAGMGTSVCMSCGGSGRITTYHHDHHDNHHHNHHRHVTCSSCFGSGRVRCSFCFGTGCITCRTCKGFCRLKCYLALTVTWKVNMKDHIVERTALPDHLIRGATGGTAFEEQMPRVWPISHFPDQTINDASRSLVDEHSRAFPLARILMQRHRVRVVPVTEAFCSWKNKDIGVFYVYGLENKVHAPDYPQQCCWGCTVI